MNALLKDLKKIVFDRLFLITTLAVGILSYGFSFTHFSMGIDDISMEIYLERGLLPESGRWVLFFINKLIPVSDFSPFFSELLGFFFLYISACVFCVLLKRVFNDKLPVSVYIVFTCFFISNPLFSENDIYYLHNTADIAWLCTACALLISYDLYCAEKRISKRVFLRSLQVVALIWIASGCYESFMFVYISCILLVIVFDGLARDSGIRILSLILMVVNAGLICVGSVILRVIICRIIPFVFRLQDVTSEYVNYRGVFSSIKMFFFSGDVEPIKELIRGQIVRYHLHGLIYIPITLYVVAMIILLVICIRMSVHKKAPAYFLIWIGVELIPLLQSIIRGYVFLQRSAQMLTILTAMMIAVFVYIMTERAGSKHKGVLVAVYVVCSVLILNFCSRINYNFYLDYMRYQNDKLLLEDMTRDLYKYAGEGYGNELTVYWGGGNSVPLAFREGFYVSVSDPRFKLMTALIDPIDSNKKTIWVNVRDDKYFYDSEMTFSFVLWGKEAFNGTNDELTRFVNMHGANLSTIHDPDEIQKAKKETWTMPQWPAEGSIKQMDGYWIVNI